MSLNDIAARYRGIVDRQEELDSSQCELNARTLEVAFDVVNHFDRFVKDTLGPLMPPGCSVSGNHRATYDASSKGYVIQMGPVALPEGTDAVRVLPVDDLNMVIDRRYKARCPWVSRINPSF
ncbi:MAG: hypothetical protein AABX53_00270 [Nanoarchaeota archaeon]